MNKVHRSALANGLRIATAPIAGLRSTAVFLAVEAGQWFEPAGRPGIARLAAQTDAYTFSGKRHAGLPFPAPARCRTNQRTH